jgi:large subunit ribosomal protein L25
MSQKLKISAETRTDLGKGASRRLRRLANKVPAILYGGEDQPASLTLVYRELDAIMKDEAFYSQVMALNISGKNQDVVVRDLQRHPATDKVTHVDFFRVDADKELQVSVPLHFLNEEACAGVRLGGGIISHLMNELEISCLPADLPAYIEVDLIDLELGSSIHLSELTLPENVVIVAFMHGDEDHDAAVVSVHAPRAIVEEVEEEASDADDADESDTDSSDDSEESSDS